MKEATVKELAEQINAHLKRFEADPVINIGSGTMKLRRFFNAGAYAAGRWVKLWYISYQGHSTLTKQQAADYLVSLDAGYIGTHFRAPPYSHPPLPTNPS